MIARISSNSLDFAINLIKKKKVTKFKILKIIFSNSKLKLSWRI